MLFKLVANNPYFQKYRQTPEYMVLFSAANAAQDYRESNLRHATRARELIAKHWKQHGILILSLHKNKECWARALFPFVKAEPSETRAIQRMNLAVLARYKKKRERENRRTPRWVRLAKTRRRPRPPGRYLRYIPTISDIVVARKFPDNFEPATEEQLREYGLFLTPQGLLTDKPMVELAQTPATNTPKKPNLRSSTTPRTPTRRSSRLHTANSWLGSGELSLDTLSIVDRRLSNRSNINASSDTNMAGQADAPSSAQQTKIAAVSTIHQSFPLRHINSHAF
jgi:hypothetical protein